MKLAVFYGTQGNSEIDMSNPYNGNPGIGGLDFTLWMVPYYLTKKHINIEVISYVVEERNYPSELHLVVVRDIFEAIVLAKKANTDAFLCRNLQSREVYQFMNRKKINVVLNAGNFISPEEQSVIADCKYIRKVICVSKQQYQMLIDTCIFKKTSYIYNTIDCHIYEQIPQISKKENVVTYMGGLYPAKGFHMLAKYWKYIKKMVPDAKLEIIGSGTLYSKGTKLGKYGIAEKDYERKFMRYLTDKDGMLLPDIHFYGTLGEKEKLEKMNRAKVGVVNPSGETETFCISAIEFEALGVPVVTRAKNGLFDTVKHRRTGILCKNSIEFIFALTNLLKDEKVRNIYALNARVFVKREFDVNKIIEEWYQLFLEMESKNYGFNDKIDKELSRHNLIKARRINAKLRSYKYIKWVPSISKLQVRKYY